jgi:hypothetical protein
MQAAIDGLDPFSAVIEDLARVRLLCFEGGAEFFESHFVESNHT